MTDQPRISSMTPLGEAPEPRQEVIPGELGEPDRQMLMNGPEITAYNIEAGRRRRIRYLTAQLLMTKTEQFLDDDGLDVGMAENIAKIVDTYNSEPL